MLEVIEKLLILQDRDRKILRTQTELSGVAPQRQAALNKTSSSQAALDAAKLKAKHIESDRKKLELDVDAHKQRINKYASQQLLTKKNEEYRALAHEIEMAKEAIAKLEDQELELMIQADGAKQEIDAANKIAATAKKDADAASGVLAERETNLQKQLAEFQANRNELAAGVGENALRRYERLLKQRGENIIVGVEHSVCGGCHMKLPTQVLIACQAQADLNPCPHCGRILYFTRGMELTVVD